MCRVSQGYDHFDLKDFVRTTLGSLSVIGNSLSRANQDVDAVDSLLGVCAEQDLGVALSVPVVMDGHASAQRVRSGVVPRLVRPQPTTPVMVPRLVRQSASV
jgi:hypothetical protein